MAGELKVILAMRVSPKKTPDSQTATGVTPSTNDVEAVVSLGDVVGLAIHIFEDRIQDFD